MKKLNKHPRLYKKMANTLKKLITNKIKFVRLKMINGQNKNSLKTNGTNIIQHHFLKPGQQLQNKLQRGVNNNAGINQTNNNNDFSRIINVASFRKIPYNEFILRLTPYDYETYLKMIKMNYSCRLEVHITNIRPIKYILGVLLEKWRNIPKAEPKINLYLIPIRELWIPKELIFFSMNDNDRIYDIGDIYTAYGSPSTNILHMKYQWNEEKINLNMNINNINNNIQNNELSFNNNNLSIQPIDSINDIHINEPDPRLIKALSKLESSNILNRSHTTIYNNLNNNQINFFSNKAIKADESQDLFDLSDLKDIEMGQAAESTDKKNINITESLNRNEEYPLFDSKYSEQDSILPFDTELLDPMELLGFDKIDNNDKKSDNLSNTISIKVRTPSISKKIHLRHKKISFVNNVKPTESMINSSFVNKSNKNNTALKLRTGYSEVFSNNNSNNNMNNVNNLAYTSNNNLSEVSSHINNSNHYGNNGNQGGTGMFPNQSLIIKSLNKDKDNNSAYKSQLINFENNSDLKSKSNINYNINSNIEEDSKDNKDNNIYNNSKNNTLNNNTNNNDNTNQRKKKKIKFVNNVSKENIKELKEIQERQRSKNNSLVLDNPENKNNNTNTISTKNISDNKNRLFRSFSFGNKNLNQSNQNININNINKENNIKENNIKDNNINLLTPVKEKILSINNDDSPMYKNNNSNKKKIILNNNNHSNNWHYGIGSGITRLLGNNNTNFGFNINDTTPFMGQNTTNYNGFFDNQTIFKSNLNNSNIFHVENQYINEDHQLSQMMFLNRGDERTQVQMINTSLINNDGISRLPNSDNGNNNIKENNNSYNSNQNNIDNNNNTTIQMNVNNSLIVNNNAGLNYNTKNGNVDDTLEKNNINNNEKVFLNKKRNVTKETKDAKEHKTKRNKKTNTSEKKSKKKDINNNLTNNNNYNLNNNMSLKNPSFNNNYNNNYNIRTGNKLMNNNYPVNKQYFPPFPYNIDIPLPSRFFEESINNYRK